jgi:ketosteroid isomerase-like protein
MSQENVEIAREFGDHWNTTGDGDWDVMDPEIVFIVDPPGFLAGTYRGYGGVRALLERFGEIRDGGTTVVALGRWRVRGAQSGAEGTQPIALVFTFRNGKLVKYRACFDRDESLADAGLRE